MKTLLTIALALCLAGGGYANDIGHLSTVEIQMTLTDLYYEMDDQLENDHEINSRTFMASLIYLQELIARTDEKDKHDLDPYKSDPSGSIRIPAFIRYLNLCREFVLTPGKSR